MTSKRADDLIATLGDSPGPAAAPRKPQGGDDEIRIAPGRSQGGRAAHIANLEDKEKQTLYDFANSGRRLPPQNGFNPRNGTIVQYNYVSQAQLEADITFLRDLLNSQQITNDTYQKQRDAMLIAAKGGPQYGSLFTGHPNVKGRTTDPEWEERRRAFENDELDMKGNLRKKK